jgi:hypothetical protein
MEQITTTIWTKSLGIDGTNQDYKQNKEMGEAEQSRTNLIYTQN